MRDERLFETALDFLAIIGRAEDLDSPWGIQKYRSLRDFGRDERQSLLRTYMRLKGLSGHDPRKDMLASSDISDFMEIVRKKGRAYVERMTDTLDGRLYGSAETLDGGSTGKRHPISMRN